MSERTPVDALRAEHEVVRGKMKELADAVLSLPAEERKQWGEVGEGLRSRVAELREALVVHFRKEEEGLFPVYLRRAGADAALVERILREHMELQGLARALRAEVAAEDVRAETLRALGELLSNHVRLEERELFEAIQATVPAEELDRLELASGAPRGPT